MPRDAHAHLSDRPGSDYRARPVVDHPSVACLLAKIKQIRESSSRAMSPVCPSRPASLESLPISHSRGAAHVSISSSRQSDFLNSITLRSITSSELKVKYTVFSIVHSDPHRHLDKTTALYGLSKCSK